MATIKLRVLHNWLKALAAVILGNLLYFLLLFPFLPPPGRHQPNRLDWGLAVDFWVCLAVFGIIDLSLRKLRPRGPRMR